VLGLRAFCDSYEEVLALKAKVFSLADMSEGKANDDGYRGVHLYFQLDNEHYPIEIQYNTLYDRQLNNWLHDYLYKKDYPDSVGRQLREQYVKPEPSGMRQNSRRC
jgi:putative GTP pyrophosphokinase